jgi:hypothetical protein
MKVEEMKIRRANPRRRHLTAHAKTGPLVFCAFLLASLAMFSGTAWSAQLTDGADREWRQLTETTGLSWNQVAEICPRDGETSCSGSIGGRDLKTWVWATDKQVTEFMGQYEPALLTADPTSVSGSSTMFTAMGFLEDMRPTFSVAGYVFFSESTSGWTASRDATGTPIEGRAGFGYPPPGGGFRVGPSGSAGVADAYTGVWLWRPAGDYSPPVISPNITGKAGNNDWYVSDVSVGWDVTDEESPIDSTEGCDPATVTSDTKGAAFLCKATSAGGTAQDSASIKRDVTPPTVTCGSPQPELELGQLGAVSASVDDITSGPATSTAKSIVNASAPGSYTAPVTGFDRAGNKTTKNCPYKVVIPLCLKNTPTILGSTGNDVINGTIGRDVILTLGGNDTIYAQEGSDVICGGDGLDRIEAGKGADSIAGDNGPDTLYGGGGKDNADGGASDDSLFGSSGDDTLRGGLNNDSIRGDDGSDTCSSGEIRMSSCEIVLP